MCFSDVNHFAKIISGGFSAGAPRRRSGYRQSNARHRFDEIDADKKTLQISALRRAKYFSCGNAQRQTRSMTRCGGAKNRPHRRPTRQRQIAPENSDLRKTARIFSRLATGKTKPAEFPRRVFCSVTGDLESD